MADRKKQLEAIDRLLTIMDDLREQCPWDRKQTFESLRYLTIEETYELSERGICRTESNVQVDISSQPNPAPKNVQKRVRKCSQNGAKIRKNRARSSFWTL